MLLRDVVLISTKYNMTSTTFVLIIVRELEISTMYLAILANILLILK